MPERFFDTSSAVKHYRVELGTPKVDAFLAEVGSQHYFSALSVVEVHSAFARFVRTGHITAAEFQRLQGRFLADIAGGLWQVVPIAADHLHNAQRLLAQYALKTSLRTLDAIQLAVALLHSGGPLDAFVCADANLCQVALMEGLVVENPELP